MKTYMAKKEEIKRGWKVINAEGKVLGRLATQVATILRGKDKPIFTQHVDTGDHVIVVNASKIKLTGAKSKSKVYKHHTGYPGGLKSTTYEELMAKDPTAAVTKAVRGMLPKNKLGRQIIKKLKVYAADAHPHKAQSPSEIN